MNDPAGRENKLTITDKELSECDREDLRHIGHIQGVCGNVLFIEYPSGKIVAHDSDIRNVVWVNPQKGGEQRVNTATPNSGNVGSTDSGAPGRVSTVRPFLVGESLQDWIPFTLYLTVCQCIEQMIISQSQRTFHFHTYTSNTYALSISSTLADYSLIGIEIELAENAHETADSFCSTLVHLGRIVEFYANEAIASTACDAIFTVMGHYDRGMVYRFNDDLSGEIIHEIKNDNVTSSYVGMRFPSSDIPLPARELYVKNGLRYIHNLEKDDVAVISNGSQIDLSQIRMRAVAKPHVIYLRNMGVLSSLSIAVVVDGELWGLLAFHGYTTAFKPALHQRIACETISKMVSVRIEATEKRVQSARIIQLGEVLMSLNPDQSLIHNLYEIGDNILAVLDCDVIVVTVKEPREQEGDFLCIGEQCLKPSKLFWKKMSAFDNREIFTISERHKIRDLGLSESDCPASGILYFRESRTQVMLGRAMRAKDVVWAGNPDEPKLRIGGILNPRHSFEKFMEKARLESKAWTRQDLNVMSVFRDRVCEHCHNYLMTQLRQDIAGTNKKYLAAIDRAQDNFEFFARMSHELRTPFHGVMGCLEMLNESFEQISPQEIRSIIKTAMASGSHMIDLLNDILDISKNKHLSHSLARNTVAYQSLVMDSVESMKTLAANRNLDLDVTVLPLDEKITVVTDRTKFIQIISNIVNNAIKFTRTGEIATRFKMVDTFQESVQEWSTISKAYAGMVYSMKEGEMLTSLEDILKKAKFYPEHPDKRWILASIIDGGVGMNPDDLVKMFAPYTQASSGSNRVFQGTGLGLFICVSLCIQLSGFIGCASTPGKGTAFLIGIPVELSNESNSFESRASSPLETAPIVMKGPILIVDDNAVNVKILKYQVERAVKQHNLDVDVICAGSSMECIVLYKERRPGMCFIDYHMPDKDGLETTREIRAWEAENSVTPSYILCYTADASDSARTAIAAAGCNDIMYKPAPKGFLEHLVERISL